MDRLLHLFCFRQTFYPPPYFEVMLMHRISACVYSFGNQDINVISNLKDIEKWTHFKTGAQSLWIHWVFIVITLIMINSFSTNVPKARSRTEFWFSNFQFNFSHDKRWQNNIYIFICFNRNTVMKCHLIVHFLK